MGQGGPQQAGTPAALEPAPHAQPIQNPRGSHSVTHLLPRLWLFLCLGTGGVGRLPATDASGQVGRRLNLAELKPVEGPVNRAEECVMTGLSGAQRRARVRPGCHGRGKAHTSPAYS